MGAALASLCALDLKFAYNFSDVHAFTYGSPRVGNLAFQQVFQVGPWDWLLFMALATLDLCCCEKPRMRALLHTQVAYLHRSQTYLHFHASG
jgi:hypothetical protein